MIHYNFAQIAVAADDIDKGNRHIDQMLDDLRARLAPMVAEWEGSSADSYNEAQRRWDNSAAEINLVLQQVARAVRSANDRMSEINTSAANSWA